MMYLPVLLLSFLSVACQASMVVKVAYGKKECFRIRVPNDEASIIRYDLLFVSLLACARWSAVLLSPSDISLLSF